MIRFIRLATLGIVLTAAGSNVSAQEVPRPVVRVPRGSVAHIPQGVRSSVTYVQPRTYHVPVLPHNHRDWSTGRENLPLAKPWLHHFR